MDDKFRLAVRNGEFYEALDLARKAGKLDQFRSSQIPLNGAYFTLSYALWCHPRDYETPSSIEAMGATLDELKKAVYNLAMRQVGHYSHNMAMDPEAPWTDVINGYISGLQEPMRYAPSYDIRRIPSIVWNDVVIGINDWEEFSAADNPPFAAMLEEINPSTTNVDKSAAVELISYLTELADDPEAIKLAEERRAVVEAEKTRRWKEQERRRQEMMEEGQRKLEAQRQQQARQAVLASRCKQVNNLLRDGHVDRVDLLMSEHRDDTTFVRAAQKMRDEWVKSGTINGK